MIERDTIYWAMYLEHFIWYKSRYLYLKYVDLYCILDKKYLTTNKKRKFDATSVKLDDQSIFVPEKLFSHSKNKKTHYHSKQNAFVAPFRSKKTFILQQNTLFCIFYITNCILTFETYWHTNIAVTR